MHETSKDTIIQLITKQRLFFGTHKTKDIEFRIANLKKFKAAILKHEKNICDALWTDLHKSYEEAYITEISIVLQEISYHLKHLPRWAKPKKVRTPLHLLPSKSKIVFEPLGVSLIIAPWNYPFQLLMNSLVGAISAGCTAIIKPSPNTPNTAKAMELLISETFDADYIALIQGGRETNTTILKERFDIIFFTGSPAVGKVVMKAASEHLTPVVLELGGKSPCIVDKDADISIAAKRIAWGKCINAGQTCIAPDYVFAHADIKDALLAKIKEHIMQMFGSDIIDSIYFPRIVNDQAFERLSNLLKQGTIVYGGQTDKEQRFIAPTIIDNIKPDFDIMQDEIFGPLLPVLTFSDISTVISYINSHEKPLALYYFGNKNKATEIVAKTSSGGGCINDTIMHIANHNLPFGGVGNSGLGKYHGKLSFLAFSNQRGIFSSPVKTDLPFKYVPFKYFKWLKRFLLS